MMVKRLIAISAALLLLGTAVATGTVVPGPTAGHGDMEGLGAVAGHGDMEGLAALTGHGDLEIVRTMIAGHGDMEGLGA
jgi:hypothetical protein